MKFRQGKAPAILYQDGKRVYEFINGRLETEDAGLIALLRERGAEPIDAPLPPRQRGEGAGVGGTHVATGGPPPSPRPSPPVPGGEGEHEQAEARGGEKPAPRKRTKAAP